MNQRRFSLVVCVLEASTKALVPPLTGPELRNMASSPFWCPTKPHPSEHIQAHNAVYLPVCQ